MNWYTFDITPVAASRPRFSSKSGTVHTAPKYSKYKKALTLMFKRIPKGDYASIVLEFIFPYPKSTPKKHRIEGSLHRVKPDSDNLCKGVLDALEQAGVLLNDSKVAQQIVTKKYTLEANGSIRFKLLTEPLSFD